MAELSEVDERRHLDPTPHYEGTRLGLSDGNGSQKHVIAPALTPAEAKRRGDIQDADPNKHDHTSDIAGDYAALQVKQTVEAAKKKRDDIRGEVGEKLKEALPKRVIPRYLRRALWSKDRLKLHKAIKRAKSEGWTNEEMTRQVRLLHENQNVTE